VAVEDRDKLRKEILDKVRRFADARTEEEFVPGKTRIPYAGRIYDHAEMASLVDSALDFWLTAGRYAERFEREYAAFTGTKFCSLTNSGSSANLIALSALTSSALGGERLRRGDKVITCAAGFPTTLNPIYQTGMRPVFVDVEIGTYNPIAAQVAEAAERGAKAVMIAHTLGNPFDLDSILKTARKHGLYLIEDCCDAAGATWDGRKVGTFGDLSTMSFYPAHHMTMGEGGAVMTSDPKYKRLAESFRDWGRDCWCAPGIDNTCGKRFKWKLGELPLGYDHKYIYSNIGYNLKATEMQAAIGVEQLKKLPSFILKRRENFNFIMANLKEHSDVLILPARYPKAEISPFGFPLTVREGAPFTKEGMVEHLESKGIQTRMLFGGNLVRQPAYLGMENERVGDLANSDFVMGNTFWIGVYPGLKREMLEYVMDAFHGFIRKARRPGSR
jgi:CDP-4-dehydro-6-deoxyglucose reductase, E1